MFYPGAVKNCDGLDNNCDGNFDEGTVTASITPAGSVQTFKVFQQRVTANTGFRLYLSVV
ncbi:MAG: putative metal-binding motif-containing protein [Bacteroidetes bacterium]|nr:putative metal-binding motif-containing protein [Bacteroidota bacterium]